jgi:hypothetical protein
MQKCSTELCLVPLQPPLLPPMAGFLGCQPESFLCLLVLEIQVPEIQIKLINHVILHIPGIKFYYKNRENHTDLPHQQENFSTSTLQLLTFSSPTTTIPHQCKGSEENFCQNFRPWQDSNRERKRENNKIDTNKSYGSSDM